MLDCAAIALKYFWVAAPEKLPPQKLRIIESQALLASWLQFCAWHKLAKNKIYKHGFSGYSNLTNDIEPTKWYDEQHSFEFEFLANDLPGTQKIYDNLKIVSNNVPPDSFVYEIVGDGFDWSQNKDLILKLNESTSKTTDVSIIGFGKPFPWLL